MAAPIPMPLFLFALTLLLRSASSQSFVGVNNGQVADNLPPPDSTAGLLKSTSIEKTPSGSKTPIPNGSWCVAKPTAPDSMLHAALDWACGQTVRLHKVDCSSIQPGAPCFEPNTIRSHASYAMNQYYVQSAKGPTDCDFSGCAMLTSENPSYNSCVYPSS